MSSLKRMIVELKRRRVIRVAVVYAAVAFVIWQVADFVLPAARLPDWAPTLVLFLTLIGFPIVLALAWAGSSTKSLSKGEHREEDNIECHIDRMCSWMPARNRGS